MSKIELLWDAPVIAGYTTRQGTLDTLRHLLQLESVPLVRMDQIHSPTVTWVEEATQDRVLPQTDACLTTLSTVALSVKTADCLPVLLYHPEGVIGAVHAGRVGTQQQILAKTLEVLGQRVTRLDGVSLWFGPAICEACYQIDPVQDLHYNLVQENLNQVQDVMGRSPFTVSFSNACTACQQDLFYSYRKEKDKAGRMFGIVSKPML